MYYEFIFEKKLDGFEGLSSSEVAYFGDEVGWNVLVVAHAHFYCWEYSEFFSTDEDKVLSRKESTDASNLIVD